MEKLFTASLSALEALTPEGGGVFLVPSSPPFPDWVSLEVVPNRGPFYVLGWDEARLIAMTRRSFNTQAEAQTYADTCHRGWRPFVVGFLAPQSPGQG